MFGVAGEEERDAQSIRSFIPLTVEIPLEGGGGGLIERERDYHSQCVVGQRTLYLFTLLIWFLICFDLASLHCCYKPANSLSHIRPKNGFLETVLRKTLH